MPGRILHILRVHGSMMFKLSRSFFVLAGIVVRDATLPVMGLLVGLQLDLSIEISDGLRNLHLAEMRLAARMQYACRQLASALLQGLIEVIFRKKWF
jgi:hypothetical protein